MVPRGFGVMAASLARSAGAVAVGSNAPRGSRGERMKVDADAAGMDAVRLKRIDEHLQGRYIAPGKIAGCQVAVLRRGVVAHHSVMGLADREREIPVAEDTVWRI